MNAKAEVVSSSAGDRSSDRSAVRANHAPASLGRLLIVDDEAAQVTALCSTLKDQGYATTGFGSSKAALAALREHEFDLLLSDLRMPEMDGIALLRAALEIDRKLVGIMMTGHGTIDSAVEAMKAGALDYILKPFKLSAILPVLSRALAMRRLRIENEELQHHLRVRTAELEAANKELEAFSFSVSHDLQAPLRSINAFSAILLKRHGAEIPEPVQRLLENICASGRRMEQLIQDLLSFSRLGRRSLAKRPVHLGRLVQQVLEELNKEREDRDLEIRIGTLPDCAGDPSLLKQALINLLSNAFKFTRTREHALVEVGCEIQAGEPAYFVRDNGAGFDMTYAHRLFGVFQRLHRTDEFEGTGIGLSIVQRIIHRHGGRIWAEGKVNGGATFYFTLPT